MENREGEKSGWWCALCLIGVVIWLVAILCGGGTDPEGATRVLKASGYSNIEMTGYRWFAGSKEDSFNTGFSATTPTGERVTGCVTSGPFKGHTIRID